MICRAGQQYSSLGLIQASTYVVDSTLEFDLQGHLSRVVDLLSKVECDALALLIVRDILGRLSGIASLQLSTINLELVGIEDQVGKAIVLCNLGVDGDSSLVGKLSAKLDIVEGDGVVGRLGPIGAYVSLVTLIGWCNLPRGENVSV
jgi:hypothetical protein